MKTHLLIDGDIVAFSSASAAESSLLEMDSFGWMRRTAMANAPTGEALVENMIASLMVGLKADTFSVYLSDPKDNWRRAVDPTYKTNRVGERPVLLDYLKDYLRERHGAMHWAGLEADDVLGILATTPRPMREVHDGGGELTPVDGIRQVVVGRDKDFKSIPGLHHAWKQDLDKAGNMLVREVSQWEGDRFHMVQTLAGDAVDGYKGCPGIGMARAAEIIDNPTRLVPKEGAKTRGVNKGEAVTRWMAEPTKDYWACIVSHYRKQGLTEKDALVTARLARILRHGEYNRDTEELRLWTPDMLQGVGR